MFRLQRVLAPLSVAAAFAVAAPAALADPTSTVTFPEGMTPVTTVTITDPGAMYSSVHLTVTAPTHADLVNTKVFLGEDGSAPYTAIGVDGVHDARYDDDFTELSTDTCSVYDSSLRYDSAPVTVSGGGTGSSFTADLPKGVIIAFEKTEVAVGVIGQDAPCHSSGVAGLAITYPSVHQTIDGFAWNAPAIPVITAVAGGRHQVALSFDQEPGTHYEIYKVVGGVRASTPLVENVRGDGDDVQYVVTDDADGHPLAAGTQFSFQVRAVRNFWVWDGQDSVEPSSVFSASATATTTPAQTVQFSSTPASTTTDRTAQFSWSIAANDAGDAPFCLLDGDLSSAVEIPCTVTGASLAGLSAGAHTLTVYTADNEGFATYAWTVVEVPTTPPPAPTPTPPAAPATTPKNPVDVDGDGIDNGWLVGGKPAPAPGTPKASVTDGKVKLKLPDAPKGAKSIRVYRADGKGGYTLVKTLSPNSKSFTDAKVKPGHAYKYKTVAVNAKGEQGKASSTASAKVKKN